jgi:hypothetical protein
MPSRWSGAATDQPLGYLHGGEGATLHHRVDDDPAAHPVPYARIVTEPAHVGRFRPTTARSEAAARRPLVGQHARGGPEHLGPAAASSGRRSRRSPPVDADERRPRGRR